MTDLLLVGEPVDTVKVHIVVVLVKNIRAG